MLTGSPGAPKQKTMCAVTNALLDVAGRGLKHPNSRTAGDLPTTRITAYKLTSVALREEHATITSYKPVHWHAKPLAKASRLTFGRPVWRPVLLRTRRSASPTT